MRITQKEKARRALAGAVRVTRHAHNMQWQARRALFAAKQEMEQVQFCEDAKRLEAFLKGEIEILIGQAAAAYQAASHQAYQLANLGEMLGVKERP